MIKATRIDDGFATTVLGHDGALIEVQIVEDRRGFELMLSKGNEAHATELSPSDVLKMGEALQVLANAALNWAKVGRRVS